MQGLELLSNGERIASIGMQDDGSFAVLIRVEMKNGDIQDPVLLISSGYAQSVKEHREWVNMELKLPLMLSINSANNLPDDSTFKIFDPTRRTE